MLVLASSFFTSGWGLSLRHGVQERLHHPYGYFSAFGRGIFIAILGMNREVSRGLRSLVLETNLVSRTRLFSLKHEDGLEPAPTVDSSCQLSESEMTKSDAHNL